MRGMLAVVLAIGLTVLSWGSYGPVLHEGQDAMDHSKLRPFICVGLAYFVVAVMIPGLWLGVRGEKGQWTSGGTIWSLIAGSLGALGALGIILALSTGGKPIYVMPLVFGGAPVINTIVTMLSGKTYKQVRPSFLLGILAVIAGATLVLVFKPSPAAKAVGEAISWDVFLRVILFTCMTILCWGTYGSMLHWGQAGMKGSRLRPLLCVGVSYFLIAVLIPLALLNTTTLDVGDWNWTGTAWSFAGGTLGCLGAIGIILALTSGGKPIYVMPLVFGGAPVMNTLITLTASQGFSAPGALFYLGLILVVGGAATTLVFAPRPSKPAPAASPATTAQAASPGLSASPAASEGPISEADVPAASSSAESSPSHDPVQAG